MGGHQPPTKRSFYLSLATSTLRFAIIVALVVGGIVLINQAFPQGGTSALPDSGGGVTTSPTPSTTPSRSPKPPPSPQIAGVRLGVYNGTTVTGLAATVMSTLQRRFGYVEADLGNAPSPVAQTTLYYRTGGDKVEAQALAANFFKDLDVKITRLQAGTDLPKAVQVAVYLGNDYAASQQ